MIIKHSWKKESFGVYRCTRCNCQKIKQPYKVGTRSFPLYYYFRNGIQKKVLPMCKSLIHSDKI